MPISCLPCPGNRSNRSATSITSRASPLQQTTPPSQTGPKARQQDQVSLSQPSFLSCLRQTQRNGCARCIPVPLKIRIHLAFRNPHLLGGNFNDTHIRLVRNEEVHITGCASALIQHPDRRIMNCPGGKAKDLSSVHLQVAVSYTHLRAHETDSYLVCRLLLDKK